MVFMPVTKRAKNEDKSVLNHYTNKYINRVFGISKKKSSMIELDNKGVYRVLVVNSYLFKEKT